MAFGSNLKLQQLVLNTPHLDGILIASSCSKLKYVTLSDELKVLPPNLFEGCSSLSSIVIPKNVTRISQKCFKGCTALQEITSLSTIAPSLDPSVFGDSPTNYVGSLVENKILRIPTNSQGYDIGDWNLLVNTLGFIKAQLQDVSN
jgi:hypothetical protein